MSILYDGEAQERLKLARHQFSFLKAADMYVFHVERYAMLVPQVNYRVMGQCGVEACWSFQQPRSAQINAEHGVRDSCDIFVTIPISRRGRQAEAVRNGAGAALQACYVLRGCSSW